MAFDRRLERHAVLVETRSPGRLDAADAAAAHPPMPARRGFVTALPRPMHQAVARHTRRFAARRLRPAPGLPAQAGLLSALGGKFLFIKKPAKAHLSILIAFLFLLTSFKIYAIRIPSLLYGSTGPFIGASFTDINAVLPFLKILIFIAIVVAVLLVINIFKTSNRFIVLAVGIYVTTSILGGSVYPFFLQKLVGSPNERFKDTPYLTHNISATRTSDSLAT